MCISDIFDGDCTAAGVISSVNIDMQQILDDTGVEMREVNMVPNSQKWESMVICSQKHR